MDSKAGWLSLHRQISPTWSRKHSTSIPLKSLLYQHVTSPWPWCSNRLPLWTDELTRPARVNYIDCVPSCRDIRVASLIHVLIHVFHLSFFSSRSAHYPSGVVFYGPLDYPGDQGDFKQTSYGHIWQARMSGHMFRDLRWHLGPSKGASIQEVWTLLVGRLRPFFTLHS